MGKVICNLYNILSTTMFPSKILFVFLFVCCCFFQAMWKVMGTYHQIKSTHEKADEMADKREANGTNEEDTDTRFNRNYVKTKLDNGLLRVWRVIQ